MVLAKMKIEDQVVNLELAKEQKGLGVKQDGYFSYFQYDKWNVLLRKTSEIFDPNPYWAFNKDNLICSAYTVAELGEMLPGKISEKIGSTTANPYFLDCGKVDSEHSYYVRYIRHATHDTFCIMRGSKEADVRAKTLIYLIKEEIIKVEDLK